MLKRHTLKIYDQFAEDIWRGRKNFTIRKNDDRQFQTGDIISFIPVRQNAQEWMYADNSVIPSTNILKDLEYQITYIESGLNGLYDGYVVLGFQPYPPCDNPDCPIEAM
jgi:hypothetical protein